MKGRQGELAYRVRGVQEIAGHGYEERRVDVLAPGVWVVWLDLNLVESVKGMTVKQTAIRYPLRVVSLAVDPEANPWGLFDMHGNVAEWTLDCMNLSYLDAPVDGSAWGRGICSSHMTRGGSWVTGAKDIRLPARFNLKNGDRNDFTGFRNNCFEVVIF